MDENEVIRAVCAHLEREGWSIQQRLHTTERGVDVIAFHSGLECHLYVEAKGGTSSSPGSARFGKPYTHTQVFDRVAKGVFTGLWLLQQSRAKPRAAVALAFPDSSWFRKYLVSVSEPLSAAGLGVFLVTATGSVSVLLEHRIAAAESRAEQDDGRRRELPISGRASKTLLPAQSPSKSSAPASAPPAQDAHASRERTPVGVHVRSNTASIRATDVPHGGAVRRWTLREDNRAEHHGVVNLSESPLFLELSWRATRESEPTLIGLFRLDLDALLRSGCIRHEHNRGPGAVRLRIVHAADGEFYVQEGQSRRKTRLRRA
jgi:hypothetical protein